MDVKVVESCVAGNKGRKEHITNMALGKPEIDSIKLRRTINYVLILERRFFSRIDDDISTLRKCWSKIDAVS